VAAHPVGSSTFQLFSISAFAPLSFSVSAFQRFSFCLSQLSAFQFVSVSAFA